MKVDEMEDIIAALAEKYIKEEAKKGTCKLEDLGMYLPAEDTIGRASCGTERLTINSGFAEDNSWAHKTDNSMLNSFGLVTYKNPAYDFEKDS